MIRKIAFTLIELLVVIAIIVLLLSILRPSLQKAKSLARIVVCQTNLRQLGFGLLLYAQDNNNKTLPYISPSLGYYWMQPISPYLEAKLKQGDNKDMKVAFCPEATLLPDCTKLQAYGGSKMAWQMNFGQWKSSYANNGWWFSDLDEAAPNYFGRSQAYIYRNTLQFKDDTPMFADGLWITGWADDEAQPPTEPSIVSYSGFETFWVDRHGTAINVSLGSGSVSRFPIGELWNLPWRRVWQKHVYDVRW